ncbi:MAG: hypothetical protein KGZ97_06905 [Bacteroidetes bacterium]|nr:hypothetical protein [Bacteroidota bacterium]
MKKGIRILAIALFIGATLFSSCKSKEICPAYTDNKDAVELAETDA